MNENNVAVNDDSQGRLYILGTRGYSAYEVAVKNGFIGTEQEWLDSLVGPQGEQGIEGKSAYEVAVENGYEGTEQEWLDAFLNADNYYNKSEIDSLETVQDGKINKKPYYFNTVAAMKSADLKDGDCAITLGYHTIGDGGAGEYAIMDSDEVLIIDNGGFHKLNNNRYAKLISNTINVKQFGAKGDGTTNDTNAFTNALNLEKNELYIPDGTYIVNNILTINNCKVIKGQSMNNTIIKAQNGFIEWTTHNQDRLIENLTIDGVVANDNTGIKGILTYSKFNNIRIKNYDIGVNTENGSWIDTFTNVYISNCNNGWVHTGGAFNNVLFENCVFVNINDKCFTGGGQLLTFDSCDFETSNIVFYNFMEQLFTLKNCYIEGNNQIFYQNTSFYLGTCEVDNCWLIAKSNSESGWLAKFKTFTNADSYTTPFTVKNCWIDNQTKDTVKPFSFNNDGTKCYVGINLLNNAYKNIKTNNDYEIYYMDLIDITNCENYGNYLNPTTINTDLPFFKYNNCIWTRHNNGNTKAPTLYNTHFTINGYLDVNQTGYTSLTITGLPKYAYAYPIIENIPITVQYDDNSLAIALLTVSNTLYNITRLDKDKTVKKIYFNNTRYDWKPN